MMAMVPTPISRSAFASATMRPMLALWAVIATENDERAVWPAHVCECIGLPINTLECEVGSRPAEVANATFSFYHGTLYD